MKRLQNTLPWIFIILFASAFHSCTDPDAEGLTVYTGATVWTGTGEAPVNNAAVSVRDGLIEEVYSLDEKRPPRGAEIVDLTGKYLIPGLINAHGHVAVAKDAMETGTAAATTNNVLAQLRLYARYGITTVVSLGDEPVHAFIVRNTVTPEEGKMARVYLAGRVLDPVTPEEAREQVITHSDNDPDWIKIRVDDGLGTREKMSPETYRSLINASHELDIPVAAHIVTLEDAKGVVQAGADLVGHSVRNAPVDDELVRLMIENDVCITPTLTREVSTYIYAERPPFFDDPFFLKEVQPWIIERLQEPEVREFFTGSEADFFRNALPLAERNTMDLHNAGVKIAMGTDSGPPARFQGYFEHLEMEMMEAAGMSPLEVLISATRNAAECTGLGDSVGTLEQGKYADFVILNQNPLENIRNLRSIESVYVGGIQIENN
jgi:imidazolonepropionase-like amidohydrolase